MCGRRRQTCPPADPDPQEILRSPDLRGRLAPENSRTRWRGSLNQARHSASSATEHSEQMLLYSADGRALFQSLPWPCSTAAAVNCTLVTQPRLDGLRLGASVCRVGQKASRGLAGWQRIRDSICLRTPSRICRILTTLAAARCVA